MDTMNWDFKKSLIKVTLRRNQNQPPPMVRLLYNVYIYLIFVFNWLILIVALVIRFETVSKLDYDSRPGDFKLFVTKSRDLNCNVWTWFNWFCKFRSAWFPSQKTQETMIVCLKSNFIGPCFNSFLDLSFDVIFICYLLLLVTLNNVFVSLKSSIVFASSGSSRWDATTARGRAATAIW